MGDKVLKIGTVHQCNCCLGSKTLHPLVSVIDLSKADLSAHAGIKFDFYTILLSECKCEAYMYGHQYYDFSDGTLLFLSPGESINMKENSKNFPSKGWILAFHPDLICGTPLGLNIHNYTFFSYLPEEALHISLREKQIILGFMDKINQELERCIDRHSKKIVSKYIELLLDYCIRFYERQFITRENKNKLLLARLDRMFDEYLDSGRLSAGGLPVLAQCAAALNLSAAYFSDLLKFETGKSLEEYFEFRRLDTARRLLSEGMHTPAAVARLLGYPNVQCFSLIFKRVVGVPPGEFRYSRN